MRGCNSSKWWSCFLYITQYIIIGNVGMETSTSHHLVSKPCTLSFFNWALNGSLKSRSASPVPLILEKQNGKIKKKTTNNEKQSKKSQNKKKTSQKIKKEEKRPPRSTPTPETARKIDFLIKQCYEKSCSNWGKKKMLIIREKKKEKDKERRRIIIINERKKIPPSLSAFPFPSSQLFRPLGSQD